MAQKKPSKKTGSVVATARAEARRHLNDVETIGIFARTHSSIMFYQPPIQLPPNITMQKYTIGPYGRECVKFMDRPISHEKIVQDVVYLDINHNCDERRYSEVCQHAKRQFPLPSLECLTNGSCRLFEGNHTHHWYNKCYQTRLAPEDMPGERASLLIRYNQKIINLLTVSLQELVDFIGESDFLASMIDKRDRFHVIDTGDIFMLIHLLKQKNPQINMVKFLDEGCNNLDDVRETPTADGITREIFHVSEEQLTDPKYTQRAFFGGKLKNKKSKKMKSNKGKYV
jgi:hypothetical protein